jgi:lipopolysaccharide transport system permease protein
MFHLIWIRRSLLVELTKREFSGKYKGSFAGFTWSFLQPLCLLAVYTLAFGVILKSRWGFSGDTGEIK